MLTSGMCNHQHHHLVLGDQAQVLLDERHLLGTESSGVVSTLGSGGSMPGDVIQGQEVHWAVIKRIVIGPKWLSKVSSDSLSLGASRFIS